MQNYKRMIYDLLETADDVELLELVYRFCKKILRKG